MVTSARPSSSSRDRLISAGNSDPSLRRAVISIGLPFQPGECGYGSYRRQECLNRPAAHLRLAVAEDQFCAAVEKEDLLILVDADDRIVRVFQDMGKTSLAGRAILFDLRGLQQFPPQQQEDDQRRGNCHNQVRDRLVPLVIGMCRQKDVEGEMGDKDPEAGEDGVPRDALEEPLLA